MVDQVQRVKRPISWLMGKSHLFLSTVLFVGLLCTGIIFLNRPMYSSVGSSALQRLEKFQAPQILKDVPGIDMTTFTKGKVTVLNVFASWCLSCRIEHPLLVSMANNPEIQMVGLAYKDEPDNTLAFLKTYGNPFDAVGGDIDGSAGIDLGIYGVPSTFLIDQRGYILYRHAGPLNERIVLDLLGAASISG